MDATEPRALLERFRSLAREFREAARQGDLPSMDAILSERRAVLNRIGPLDGNALRDEERIGWRETLEAILDLDREAEDILERARQDLGAELVALNEGRRGLSGYAAGPARASRIDERG